METTKMVKWQLKAFDETEFYEVYQENFRVGLFD